MTDPLLGPTPGPWRWEVNLKYRQISLISRGLPGSMNETVMDFERWGMQSAAPRFRRPSTHLMAPAREFAVIIPGREHHESWARFLDHPDARLMEAAPDMLDVLMSFGVLACSPEWDEKRRAAISKALGR